MRDMSDKNAEVKSVSVIGNYLPRRCGIATFTRDLAESLSAEARDSRCRVVAMNDKPEGYDYPENVQYEINQHNLADYKMAAEFINLDQPDIVCLQHEYGIFGGAAGAYILELLTELRMPVVTTLHTVLIEPSKEYFRVIMNLAEISDRLVVMSRRAADILNTVYDIPRKKIVYIPHGIPDMPFIDPNYYKDQFGLLGRQILMTFGLLSRNKGIEYVLQALPKVVEQFPDLTYLILGATHPHVLQNEGEKYRERLQDMVRDLGITDNVEFQNRFVSNEELCDYLAAADLYVTPYIDEAQITSGTLAYALGTGKAVISTPYWYAREMLADNRGLLVPFKDSDSMADGILNLLSNDAERHEVRINAYDYSRDSVWKQVAKQYHCVFREVKEERNRSPRAELILDGKAKNGRAKKVKNIRELPVINLKHLQMLTDDTGLLQHAKYTAPDRNHGYCTDDNARALIVAALTQQLSHVDTALADDLCNRYLSFVLHAFDSNTGRFRNFMGYNRQWLETMGSEDSHGRGVWALGMAIDALKNHPRQKLISSIFNRSVKAAETFQSPRSIAFALIGMDSYLKRFPGDSDTRRAFKQLSQRLYGRFRKNSTGNWPWPEDKLTYANGKLPHALLAAGRRLNRGDMIQTGLESLEWLLSVQTEKGQFVPVGNQGWYQKKGEKARFDQQPIEANAMIEACISAFQVSHDDRWLEKAVMCFNWFLGQNDLHLPLYDAKTGGCRDGLESDGINQNEGAESTLACLLSLTALHHLSVKPDVKKSVANTSEMIS